MFDSGAQTLVNTVNCVGVMGKGVALEFRKRFPEMYKDYLRACEAGAVRLGKPYLFRRTTEPWILNFPTKGHWRSVTRLSDVIAGLRFLQDNYAKWGITSLAVPPLGCGQGQLEWRVVGPTLYRYLSKLDIPVDLYAPYGTPSNEVSVAFLRSSLGQVGVPESKVPPSWVALVWILARIEAQPYHWPVGRTIFQKIAYFATALGLPTGIVHREASFGPFSSEVKPLITRLVNNGLLREEQLGKMFHLTPGPTFKDAARLYRSHLLDWQPLVRKVADLFLRMPTGQAEIAATVYFASQKLRQHGRPSEYEILQEVKRWKKRRRPPLSDEEVGSTIRTMNLLNWLQAVPSSELPVSADLALEEIA